MSTDAMTAPHHITSSNRVPLLYYNCIRDLLLLETNTLRCTTNLVFAVKHDGRHKARLVAGGHLTETPIDSVYSSVVSLRGIRIITFLAELNGLESWSTDISCAYLESYTQEKVYIIAGPEFGT